MAMVLNPYELKGNLGSPLNAQAGINQLLNMQGKSLEGLTDTIGNIGKINRTNTVNDLIARGGLEGLNELEAQQKLIGTAGGSLTDQGQANIDQLLKGTGALDQRTFQEAQQLQRQEEARNVADLLNERTVQKAETLQENKELNQKTRNEMEKANVFKTFTGKDGIEYAVKKSGAIVPLKEALTTSKGSRSGKTQDAISKLGLSKDAEVAYRNMSRKQQKSFMDDEGNLKDNIAWVAITEVRDKSGKVRKKTRGYFEDRNTGRRVATSSKDLTPPKPKEKSFGSKLMDLF